MRLPSVAKRAEEEPTGVIMRQREVVAREAQDVIAAPRVAEEPADARAVAVQSPLKI